MGVCLAKDDLKDQNVDVQRAKNQTKDGQQTRHKRPPSVNPKFLQAEKTEIARVSISNLRESECAVLATVVPQKLANHIEIIAFTELDFVSGEYETRLAQITKTLKANNGLKNAVVSGKITVKKLVIGNLDLIISNLEDEKNDGDDDDVVDVIIEEEQSVHSDSSEYLEEKEHKIEPDPQELQQINPKQLNSGEHAENNSQEYSKSSSVSSNHDANSDPKEFQFQEHINEEIVDEEQSKNLENVDEQSENVDEEQIENVDEEQIENAGNYDQREDSYSEELQGIERFKKSMKEIRADTLRQFQQLLPHNIAYHLELCVFTDFDYFTGTYSEKSKELLKILETDEELRGKIVCSDVKPQEFVSMKFDDKIDGDNIHEQKEEIVKDEEQHEISSEESNSSHEEINSLKLEPSEVEPPIEKDDEYCCVCLENPRTHIIVPCGHKCCCGDCADGVLNSKVCPLCRTEITQVIKVYE